MKHILKNIEKKASLDLKNQVEYQDGQIVSKTLVQNNSVSITLFTFDKGEEISTHSLAGDAMVVCLDGRGKITISGDEYFLKEGETIIMPEQEPHTVFAEEKCKIKLVVGF